jgi:chorismate dehydratase
MEKVKVSAVSYLNTRPFLHGLQNSPIANQVDLSLDIPSAVALKLTSREATIGLLPAVVIPEVPNAQMISEYGICCDGEVGSVCIYSQSRIDEIDSLYLDYQSRTSVELAKVLLKDFWKVTPRLISSFEGYENRITGNTAGLIIGDRALQLKNQFRFSYDLGKAWKELTGLPFVFACWVSNLQLSQEFLGLFSSALKSGVDSISEVAKINQPFYQGIDVLNYLGNKIQYHLDPLKHKSLRQFQSMLQERTIPV